MGRKVRKQINIDESQDLALKREAERLGVSESEVVRLALEAMQASVALSRREEAVVSMRQLWAGRDREYGALRDAGAPVRVYRFRRQDAYDDRFNRHDR